MQIPIKHWIRRWKNMRLVTRLIIMNITLISIPLVISSWISSIGYSDSIQNNAGQYQADVVREFTSNLDAYMNELVLLSILPYQSPEMMEYLEHDKQDQVIDRYEDRLLLERFVRRIRVNGRVDIAGVALFTNHTHSSYVELPDSPGRFAESGDRERLLPVNTALSGKGYFVAPHAVLSDNGTVYQVFSMARKIRSLDDGQELGTLVIDVPAEALTDRITHLAGSPTSLFAMMDQHKQLIYKSPSFPVEDATLQQYGGEGTLTIDSGRQSVLLTYQTSPVTHWTVLQAVPVAVLVQDARQVNRQMIWLGGICLIISVIVSIFHAMRITRPLSVLRDSMKLVERGEFDIALPVHQTDEIGHLSRTFNIMVSRLGSLTYRLYETEIREKNAQIASLQSQINPHFLYNTLGSISMYAELEGNREVVQMTNHLSALLRYSIGSDHSEVTIEQELEHVRGYLSIQRIRYDERLSYTIHADPLLLQHPIIRLTLQPLVENAIIHGLERGRGDIYIQIEVHRQNKQIQIDVIDNGPGMENEWIEEQHHHMEAGILPEGPGGHGLVNVHRRIALKYGNEYGITLHNRDEGGLQVIVTMPIVEVDHIEELKKGDTDHV